MRHVMLVGATDGIGLALAREHLSRGWRLALLGRDAAKLADVAGALRTEGPGELVTTVVCDVTDATRVDTAFDEALRALGQLDRLVYCAGLMAPGADPTGRVRAARAEIAVNLTGAIPFLERAADRLERAGRGQVAAIGSVAGERGRRGDPGYCAAKAGLHTYLEGLRHRLHDSGVRVTTIEPGYVRTRMLGDRNPPGAISPAEAARRIADGLDRGREVFYVPGWWRLVAWLLRLTPRWVFKRFGPP